jgi:anion-transporting  ArsA/GET3 family ATPase
VVAVKPSSKGLLDRRLLVVVGKGGVGKTTIACGLALAASKLGKRTLLAEVDGVGRAAALLEISPGAIGEAKHVRPSLSVMSVDGSIALQEYLEIIVPVKRVLQAVFESRIYRYFVAAAPGLKELMTIGKIWYEAERTDAESGERMWDLVILDAPATGHSLQYLGMPRAAHEVFRAGLVGRESQRLIDLLTDRERTAVNLVTTAEEMPVNETLEMYERLRGDLDMPLGAVFVNRIHHTDLQEEEVNALEACMPAADPRDQPLLHEVHARAREELGWATINRSYLEKLSREVKLPIIEVPFFFTEEFGATECQAVAHIVEQALVSPRKQRSQRGRT